MYDEELPIAPGERVLKWDHPYAYQLRSMMEPREMQFDDTPDTRGVDTKKWETGPSNEASRARGREAIDALRSLGDTFRGPDEDLVLTEKDIAKKTQPLSGVTPGYWVGEDLTVQAGAPDRKRDLGADADEVFELMLRRGVLPPVEPVHAPVKRRTNHGHPDFLNSDASILLAGIMAQEVLDSGGDYQTVNDTYAKRLGVEAREVTCTYFYRFGHTTKPVVQGAYDADGQLRIRRVRPKYAPRMRGVNGVPLFMNLALNAYANGAKYALQATDIFGNLQAEKANRRVAEITRAMRLRGLRPVWFEDDLGSYDRTVSLEWQDATDRFYSQWMRWSSSHSAVRRAMSRLNILTPPVNRSDAAYTLFRKGNTTSGERTTSITGCVINFNRVVRSVAKAVRCTIEEALAGLGVWWFLFVWGDDTLLCIDENMFSVAAYEKESRDLGFIPKIKPGRTFLMKWLPGEAGPPHGLGIRGAQNTVAADRPTREIMLRIAGFEKRWLACVGDPLAEQAYQAIRPSIAWIDDLRLDGSSLHSLLHSLKRVLSVAAIKAEVIDAAKRDKEALMRLLERDHNGDFTAGDDDDEDRVGRSNSSGEGIGLADLVGFAPAEYYYDVQRSLRGVDSTAVLASVRNELEARRRISDRMGLT
jgi:hypothetical protein